MVAITRAPLIESETPPILVLLHGFGADETDLIGLADLLDPRLHVISIRGPHQTSFGGYCWFDIEFYSDGSRRIDEAQAVDSRNALIHELAELPAKLGLKGGPLLLAGFSQGAMIAAGVLFQAPELVTGAWLMSGRYVAPLDSASSSPQPIPVLAQHGVYDELLPIDEGRELAQKLREHGYELTYGEFPSGHEIHPDQLSQARDWFNGFLK